jgi:hypothetical protein
VAADVGPVSYAEGAFTLFKSYPVTTAAESIKFFLEPYINEYELETIALTGVVSTFILNINACY